MHEAITYLGLDRLGLARPDKAMYRLLKKGALHPKKIAGHFAFDKTGLEKLLQMWTSNEAEAAPETFKLHKYCTKENAINPTNLIWREQGNHATSCST